MVEHKAIRRILKGSPTLRGGSHLEIHMTNLEKV